jgi:flagellar basal-body rod modification protein FlgD
MTGINSVASTGAVPEAATANQTSATDTAGVTKQMFLKLLVAQIKNQDPLSPADGVQFLTQLAQFTQLEQTLALNENVQAIRDLLAGSGASTGQNATPGS